MISRHIADWIEFHAVATATLSAVRVTSQLYCCSEMQLRRCTRKFVLSVSQRIAVHVLDVRNIKIDIMNFQLVQALLFIDYFPFILVLFKF